MVKYTKFEGGGAFALLMLANHKIIYIDGYNFRNQSN